MLLLQRQGQICQAPGRVMPGDHRLQLYSKKAASEIIQKGSKLFLFKAVQQQDFLRDTYRRQDQPSEITYHAFVAQVAREAANRLAHGTIAGKELGVFSTREIAVFAICTTITLLTALFAG